MPWRWHLQRFRRAAWRSQWHDVRPSMGGAPTSMAGATHSMGGTSTSMGRSTLTVARCRRNLVRYAIAIAELRKTKGGRPHEDGRPPSDLTEHDGSFAMKATGWDQSPIPAFVVAR